MEKNKLKTLLITVLGAGTIAGGIILLNEADYQTLKSGIIAKQQDWSWCIEKGKITVDNNGVYTACILAGITYEPFTFSDLQVMAEVMDKEVKKTADKKMNLDIRTGENINQQIMNKIK